MSQSKKLSGVLIHLFHSLPFIVLTVLSVPIIGMALFESAKYVGLRKIPVFVLGTGSMYPSLYWSTAEGGPEDESKQVTEEYRTTPHMYRYFQGINLAGRTVLGRPIGFGDMVAFRNDKTAEILDEDNRDLTTGFIKRVIGLPGDQIELRDGFVYRNGELLSEPYITTPRSTYGGAQLKDCVTTTVPADSYFVLGDNRKVSSDSRIKLGFISRSDIQYILPYEEQQLYHSLWRDSSKDSELIGQPTLSAPEFLTLVNAARAKQGVGKLTLRKELVQSSTLRGDRLLKDENTSYNLSQAVKAAGYSNIVLGEFVSNGHFSAKELLENLLFHPSTAKQLLNKEFTDLGVAEVDREINSCPSQIIVGHLGGYRPADYDESTIASWRKLRDNLRSVLPSWEQATTYEGIDQAKLNQLLTIFRRRLSLAEEIITTMEKRAWFTPEQETRIKNDELDAAESERLSNELNK
jgi:signal peptidase I